MESDVDEDENWNDTCWSVQQVTSSERKQAEKPTQPADVASSHMHSTVSPGNFSQINNNLSSSSSSQSKQNGGKTVLSRMQLNDNKAGMQGLDKEKINSIIHEISKGSKFYENERKKEEQLNKKIEEQGNKILSITPEQRLYGATEGNRILQELRDSRDLSRSIVHVDMDAFYAAVEMKDNPSLRDKPMAVGSTGMLSTSNYEARKYGVRAAMPGFIGKKLCPQLVIVPPNFDKYTATSKEIRQIFSEYDPHFCPMSLDEAYLDFTDHLIRRTTLSEKSRTFYKSRSLLDTCICDKYDGLVENNCAIDAKHDSFGNTNTSSREECNETNSEEKEKTCGREQNFKPFKTSPTEEIQTVPRGTKKNGPQRQSEACDSRTCDVCGKLLLAAAERDAEVFGMCVEEAVREMRFRIQQKTQLTASAGIAPNMMLAKVCSDKNKPNGQYRIPPTEGAVMQFVRDLPIRKISGIGKVSERLLSSLGIVTCSDISQQMGLLYHLYSPISFNYFLRISIGIGSTTVERDGERKSMSVERTFSEINKPEELYQKCKELSEALSEDMKEEQLLGKTVTLKVKTVTFEVKTRAQTLLNFTNSDELISAAAQELLKGEIMACAGKPLRLRLMGVRMSNFVRQEQMKDHKQVTITGMFQKLQHKSQGQQKVTAQHSAVSNKLSSSLSPSKIDSNNISQKNNVPINNTSDQCEVRNVVNCEVFGKNAIEDSTSERLQTLGNGTSTHLDVKKIQDSDIDNDVSGISMPYESCAIVGKNAAASSSDNLCDVTSNGDAVYTCPVCNGKFQYPDQQAMNDHIDACLNVDHKEISADTAGHSGEKHVHSNKESFRTISDDPNDKTTVKCEFVCPMCQNAWPHNDFNAFNIHVNSCIATSDSTHENTFTNNIDHEKKDSSTVLGLETNLNPIATKNLDSAEVIRGQSDDFVCPVCGRDQSSSDLDGFNRHVDACLSRSAIKEMLQEQNSQTTSSSQSLKRNLKEGNIPPAKKRKPQTASDSARRIDSFFK